LRHYGSHKPRTEQVILEQIRAAHASERGVEKRTVNAPSDGRQTTQVIDAAEEQDAARAGVRETQQTSTERKLVVRVDTETETVDNNIEARRSAINQLQQLMVRSFNRGAQDEQQFVATVSRGWLVFLMEPVRLRIELVLSAPDTLARLHDLETNIDPERMMRYVSANVIHFTINLFGGVPELAMPVTALNEDAQRACLHFAASASLLFDSERCRFTSTHELLDGFRYNAAIDAALDRSRLLAAACFHFVDSVAGTVLEDTWRDIMSTTLGATLRYTSGPTQAKIIHDSIEILDTQ
jgi:hypothetical protein